MLNKKLKWKKQHGKPNCGQIALSVITGKSLKEIYKIVGHDGSTKTKELASCLKHFGYNTHTRLKVLKTKPQFAIGKLKYPNRVNWHWVVVDGEKIYDGIHGTNSGKVKWKRGWKLSSFLEIKNA